MIGWLVVWCTSATKPQASSRFFRNPTWSAMPSPVRLTEAMRTESRRVRTSASERSRTAASIMAGTWRGIPPFYSRHGERPAHALVAVAAEDVAEECERARLVRRECEPHRLAGHDIASHAEVGDVHAHEDVLGGELEDHGLSFFQRDVVGREDPPARAHLDHARILLRQDSCRAREREQARAQDDSSAVAHGHPFTVSSLIRNRAPLSSASTSRKPSPL